MSDSAGIPWAGRHFEPNPSADDDGRADPRLIEALRRFAAHELGQAEVVEAVRTARLLAPLLAEAGKVGTAPSGHAVDKTQELSIVTVAAADGRRVLPAFTSVAALTAWHPAARPVPASGERVALAAVGEGTDLVVLDPTSSTEFMVRRPAVWALARGESWLPCYLDDEVLAAFLGCAAAEAAIRAVQLAPGDPEARMAGPELLVHLTLEPGLGRDALDALLGRQRTRWAQDSLIADRVDSIGVRLAAVS